MKKLIIAKPGYDITANDENLIFNSKNTYKIASKGELTVNWTGVENEYFEITGHGEAYVEHNFGYVPVAFVFNKDEGMQIPFFINMAAGVSINYTFRITATRLYITVDDSANPGAMSMTFKYQIMHDKII